MSRKGTKKRKRKAGKASAPPLGETLRRVYSDVLARGDMVKEGHNVYWDLGPGQRAQVARQHFLRVAKSEGLAVEIFIVNRGKSLLIAYPPEQERRLESIVTEALEEL